MIFRQVHRAGAAALVVSSLLGCGADTGLWVPAPRVASGDAGPPPDVCVAESLPLERHTSETILVIDRSGSMSEFLEPQGSSGTRWEALRDALTTTLPAYQDSITMGAVFFPSWWGACEAPPMLDVAPGDRRALDVVHVLQHTSPSGATPTYAALRFAAGQFSAAGTRGHSRSLVLATDGGPNCNDTLDPATCTCAVPTGGGPCIDGCFDDDRTVELIAELARQGVPTYVIGIARDSNTVLTQTLDRMAVAGARPNPNPGAHRYYSAQRGDELTSALAAVQKNIVECEFVTASPPAVPSRTRVEVDGVVVARDTTHRDGWDWNDPTRGEITFFGPSCDRAVHARASVVARSQCGGP